MPFLSRLRRPGTRKAGMVALTVALAAFLAACGQDHPDSIFHQRTDVNRDVDYLFKILIYAGTAVFIFVEGILVWTLIKFRKRPGQPEPEHVHGNTTLEIAWTVIPLVILMLIAVPTVRTIFKTQAEARSDALQIEVIGHQWWWEFRYPQYQFTTANEIYLPLGRTVNFKLNSADVIHSFWIPSLSGKRDVMPGNRHTNYLWFMPDSSGASVWNGACVEYCGTSHANMRFKTFTVSAADFESWARHQQEAAVGSPAPAAPAPAATPGQPAAAAPATKSAAAPKANAAALAAAAADSTQKAAAVQVAQAGFISVANDKVPAYAVPQTPIPAGIDFDDSLLGKGDVANGAKLMISNGGCLACHGIKGNPSMMGVIGPNLTHVATRTTIAAGLFPNDARHLARWIKNARVMKPGVTMFTIGKDQYDPITKSVMKQGLTDQQIADVVAYLQSLK
ncbi:MAG TPA: cytochrome c oxidase subunit II [Gemmatimonadaceae bacterium]|nr:cytochrome c oxidase subunit II [Gemmatimonadaceae bacterium]